MHYALALLGFRQRVAEVGGLKRTPRDLRKIWRAGDRGMTPTEDERPARDIAHEFGPALLDLFKPMLPRQFLARARRTVSRQVLLIRREERDDSVDIAGLGKSYVDARPFEKERSRGPFAHADELSPSRSRHFEQFRRLE